MLPNPRVDNYVTEMSIVPGDHVGECSREKSLAGVYDGFRGGAGHRSLMILLTPS